MPARFISVCAIALFGCVILSACTREQSPEPPVELVAEPDTTPQTELDGKALIQERCTKCHDTGRIFGHSHSRAEWEKDVDRMITKGAKLNAEEREAVIEFLSEQ